ncbi:putative xylitol oxidase [Aquicella siphonis]|uniref:Putative xylitol oxidase n=1 Tax=Aquicella siphonis TaxID=254247 RepID=A0A5E4PM03_9COXI|nr:FAD-binding protein [Aquicella siphonis]VVC77246.1 putative xylitol oxidase [Aquicella siphonis]
MPITEREMEMMADLAKNHGIRVQQGWKNFSENLNVAQAMVLDIDDVSSLQAVIRLIHKLNQDKKPDERILLRAAAGGRNEEYSESFSFTPGAEGDVIVRLVGKEFRRIRKTSDDKIMSVGASVQIGELDKKLYEKYDLALPTSSLIPYVTVAGLSANAGHGTGRDQPGFSGLIRAITLCLPNGEIVRIDESDPDFHTIRAANLGLFGIVLNVELECTKAKKMECIMDVSNIPDFIRKVKAGLFSKYPYVSVMYVPTYQSNEMTSERYNNVIIYCWTPVDKSTPDENNCPYLAHLGQELQINLERNLRITDLLRDYPHLIPYFTRYLVTQSAIGNKDTRSVGPWHMVHYQTAFPRDIDDADYLFQVGQDCEEITAAISKIVTTLTEFAHEKQYPLVDAVYLRLFTGTNGGLSTSAHEKGQYVCGLDMVSGNGIAGYAEFKQNMADYFMRGPLHAKPHWGKYVPTDVDYRKIYGNEFDAFIAALHKWYERHQIEIDRSMLLNRFHCEILQLPYYPAFTHNRCMTNMCHIDTAHSKSIADDICCQLDKGSEDAENFRRRLQVIGNEKIRENKSAFFESSHRDSDEMPITLAVNDKPAKKKGCCVIL